MSMCENIGKGTVNMRKKMHGWRKQIISLLILSMLVPGMAACLDEKDRTNDSGLQSDGRREQSGRQANPFAELDVVPGDEQGTAQGQSDEPAAEPTGESVPHMSGQGDLQEAQPTNVPAAQLPEHIDKPLEQKLLVSEFSTWYGSSSPQRCNNIERAAVLLNGYVIAPQEVFSCAEAIGPIDEENGYLPAGTFVMGKVQQGIGGGVCQVSTTLYNAALYAGLTILERAPHSMAVSYVDPARDAALAGNYKDLKLRNDFEYPVMIEAFTEEGNLYFRIHTAQEDIGNQVELVSVVVEEIPPGDPVVTVDETKPHDYYEVTQKAHTGYVAELYRVISRDGVELLREKINTSQYAATPQYVTVGSDGT